MGIKTVILNVLIIFILIRIQINIIAQKIQLVMEHIIN